MTSPKIQPQILIVDDEAELRDVLRRSLEHEGYRVTEAVDGVDALAQVAQNRPDLILLDVSMPNLDGNAVCARLKSDPKTRLIPVIMHSALTDLPQRLRAHEEDADDYLVKGSSLLELQARIRSLLRLKRYTDALESAESVLAMVARMVDKRDHYVREHCTEVAGICAQLGERLGLPEDALERLRLAATFHDIGKIGVEDAILQKQGPLDEAERQKMREHAAMGAELIEPMKTLAGIAQLIRHHHEKMDGSGYPDRLKGEAIPLEVRVLTVADIYQALVSDRPYKPPMTPEAAMGVLQTEAAKGWWDPVVVAALVDLVVKGRIGRAPEK